MRQLANALLLLIAVAGAGYFGYQLGLGDGASRSRHQSAIAALSPAATAPRPAHGEWATTTATDEISGLVTRHAQVVSDEGMTLFFTCHHRLLTVGAGHPDMYPATTAMAEYRVDANDGVRGVQWDGDRNVATSRDPKGLIGQIVPSENLVLRVYDGRRTFTGHFNMMGAEEAAAYVLGQCDMPADPRPN